MWRRDPPNKVCEREFGLLVATAVGQLARRPAFRLAADGEPFPWAVLDSALPDPAVVPDVVADRVLAEQFTLHVGIRALAQLYLDSERFPAAGRRPVRRGDLIYRPTPDRDWFGRGVRLSPRYESTVSEPLSSPVPSFAIAQSPLFERYDVHLDLSARRLVDELFSRFDRVAPAVCVPNLALDGGEYAEVETWMDGPQGYFYGVAAADLDRQRRLFEKGVLKALGGGANVILFPELSSTEQITAHAINTARAAVPSTLAGPLLLIPGSWHRAREDGNMATGLMFWHPPDLDVIEAKIAHKKFRPLERARLKPGDPTGYDEWLGTPTDGRAVIRVYLGELFSFTVLICADAMGTDIHELLRELRVKLVLVPAMSRTHTPFTDLASAVRGWQGTTVVAMTPWCSSGPDAAGSAVCLSPIDGAVPLVIGPSVAVGGSPGTTFAPTRSALSPNGSAGRDRDAPAVCFYLPQNCSCNWVLYEV